MSSSASVLSSPVSCVSPSLLGTGRKTVCDAGMLEGSFNLSGAFHDTRMHLHRTHEGMQHLMARCEAVGQAMERCAEALANIPASPGSSFASAGATTATAATAATAAAFSDRSSVSAAATTSHRQLYWSLSQYHTHVAQLLSAASMRAYDAAVTDKIDHRLRLMERSAATLHRCVAGDGDGGAAAVAGSAGQLEQLACTRFAPAYEGFLLYAVATLGDFCALWDAAAQRSAEDVVWSSSLEGASTMAVPLHSEHHTPSKGKSSKKAHAVSTVKESAQPTDAKKRRSSSSAKLAASFGDALRAVEELRDGLFDYVRLLHGTVRQFKVAATALAEVLATVKAGCVSTSLRDCVERVDFFAATLEHSHTSMITRRACYEAMLEDNVLRPLRQLQEDSKKGVRLDLLFDVVHYPLMEKTSSALERALRRLTEPRSKESASYHPSRSSSDVSQPSNSLEVLHDVWNKTSELCVQIGTEVSSEFTQRVDV